MGLSGGVPCQGRAEQEQEHTLVEAILPPHHRLLLNPAKLARAKELHQLRTRGRGVGSQGPGRRVFSSQQWLPPNKAEAQDTPSRALLRSPRAGKGLGRSMKRLLL